MVWAWRRWKWVEGWQQRGRRAQEAGGACGHEPQPRRVAAVKPGSGAGPGEERRGRRARPWRSTVAGQPEAPGHQRVRPRASWLVGWVRGAGDFCWLTQEDLVRYFLNSISVPSLVFLISVRCCCQGTRPQGTELPGRLRPGARLRGRWALLPGCSYQGAARALLPGCQGAATRVPGLPGCSCQGAARALLLGCQGTAARVPGLPGRSCEGAAGRAREGTFCQGVGHTPSARALGDVGLPGRRP